MNDHYLVPTYISSSMSADRISSPRTFYKLIFFSAIFIILVARVVIAWRSPRQRRVLPAPVAEDVAALRRARRAADRRAAEAEAARLAAEALREETAGRRDVIEALHRRVEELERELAMRDAFQEA